MNTTNTTTEIEVNTSVTLLPDGLNFSADFTTALFFTNDTTTATFTNVAVSSGATARTTTSLQQNTSIQENPLRNNSFQYETPAVLLFEAGLGVLAVRAAFLVVFIVVGFISNCMLITALAQRNRRKPSYLNLLLINIAAANLLDCLVNLTLVLGATVTERWDYGDLACQLNAFFFQLTSVTTCMGLCALLIDRFIAVKSPTRYYVILSVPKVNMLIIYSWLQGVALSFAPITDLIKADIFPKRYLCSVSKGTSLSYVCLVPLIGYIIPLIIIIGLSSAIVHISRQQKKRRGERKDKKQYQRKIVIEESLRKDINTSKYVGVLVVIWLILEGPYLILNSVEQILKSSTLKTTSTSQEFTYPWELEVAFTWVRLSFPMFLPILTFAWRRDVWHKFKNLILCRKSNHIDDNSPDRTPEARDSIPNSYSGGTDTIGRKKEQQPLAFNIPVLYATDEGIHVQTLSKRTKTTRSLVSPDHFEDKTAIDGSDDMDKTDASGIITARKCDVNGSQDLLQIDDDTSDYDSNTETEPFALSNNGPKNQEVDDKSISRRAKSPYSESRHNSEIVLIAGSDKSFDNEAFLLTEEAPSIAKSHTGQVTRTRPTKEKGRNSSIGSQTAINEAVKNEQEKSMKHMRSSSDSGRGSEEGTISRREKMARPPIPVTSPVTVANVTTNETSTDASKLKEDTDQMSEDKSKVRRKRRRKKKTSDLDDPASEANTLEIESRGDVALSDLIAMQHVNTRPPIRLKPIDAPPSPNLSSGHNQSPAKLPKKLPSPYKRTTKTGGINGRSLPKDLNQVQAKESEGIQYHNRSDSETSAITEANTAAVSVGVLAVPANMAARRRRTNTTAKVIVPDRLAESDITGQMRNHGRHESDDLNENPQRLTHSDSAADLRRLSQAKDGEVRKSPRPSPKPRKARKVSDLSKTENGHLSPGEDLTYW